MTEAYMFSIRVPASTANLGPGFDSIGLALSLYLTVDVYESDHWKVEGLSDEMKHFPADETHFIVKIARKTAKRYGKEMTPCSLKVRSDIPLARGLGSSAAAVAAGIELADALCDLHLDVNEKIHIASIEEGHPDNAAASISGGLAVGEYTPEKTSTITVPLQGFEVVAVIPKEELLTKHSRQVLPDSLSFADSVKGSAVANTLLAALLTKNYRIAGEMMRRDLFHQPYRRELVPLLMEVEDLAYDAGAFGAALSGAGPTVVCFVEESQAQEAADKLDSHFSGCSIRRVKIDNEGCRLYTKKLST